ncbi:MAG: heavy-metal-associated domain-containing protein [Pirellulales bacterium]
MKSKVFALLAVLSISVSTAIAAELPPTVITVEKMHCANCAKRIGAKLYEVRGVAEVKVDVKKKTLFVISKNKVSPRALWEAVESANDKPLVLDGPSGKFKTKPTS